MKPHQLQDRLITFGIAAIDVSGRLPGTYLGAHVSRQLARSAISPAANYAEARAAESPRDFVHKMQICLKELRETSVWLQVVEQLSDGFEARNLTRECDELTAIFVASINTAKRNLPKT